jgi:hypothetical protein
VKGRGEKSRKKMGAFRSSYSFKNCNKLGEPIQQNHAEKGELCLEGWVTHSPTLEIDKKVDITDYTTFRHPNEIEVLLNEGPACISTLKSRRLRGFGCELIEDAKDYEKYKPMGSRTESDKTERGRM